MFKFLNCFNVYHPLPRTKRGSQELKDGQVLQQHITPECRHPEPSPSGSPCWSGSQTSDLNSHPSIKVGLFFPSTPPCRCVPRKTTLPPFVIVATPWCSQKTILSSLFAKRAPLTDTARGRVTPTERIACKRHCLLLIIKCRFHCHRSIIVGGSYRLQHFRLECTICRAGNAWDKEHENKNAYEDVLIQEKGSGVESLVDSFAAHNRIEGSRKVGV
jgi:hypothetical protein